MFVLLVCEASFTQDDKSKTHLGDCILIKPAVDAPRDVYYETDLIRTDAVKPFNKQLAVYGMILVGNDGTPDQFMRDVARTIREIFPQDRGLDSKKQHEMLTNLHRYKALIPMPRQGAGADGDNFFDMNEEDEQAWGRLTSQCSVCDAIFKTDRGQVMEVVEHILHYASSIGLHYTFPEAWGISESSKIHGFMKEAIAKKYYDVGGYVEIEPAGTRMRVEIQEFAYWVISTAWNLQQPYGGGGGEWTIKNREDLKKKMPALFAMHEETVGTIMLSPSLKSLDKFPDTPGSDRDED